MNIAYDLRYADGHFTGVGTVAYRVMRELLELDTPHHFHVLWHPAPRQPRYDIAPIARHPRVTLHERRIATMRPLEPFQLGAWLREVRPDVYYSPLYWKPAGAPCPCVLTIHDLWPFRLPGDIDPVRGAILRWVLRHAAGASRIVTVSEFSRREILEILKLPPDRVVVARNGAATPSDAAPVRPPALADSPFALVVGDNRPRKSLALLARVWAGFGAEPPLRLVGVGPANPRFPSLGTLAEREGARAVSDFGWVPEAQLAWLYAHTEMVLYPTTYEGFGLPLTEAFARGVPTLASDIPVLREIGEGAARLVAPGDPPAWAAAIRELLASPAERDRMRRAGLERAGQLTYRRTAEAVLAVLERARGEAA